MPLQTIDPERAVEIIKPKYGSGYRIGGRLVLTAKHLFPDGIGSDCRIRAKHAFGECDARIVWAAPSADIALVELPEAVENDKPVGFGQFPDQKTAIILNFDLIGWPKWAQTRRDGERAKAGGRHIPGKIYLADFSSEENLLVIEPSRGPDAPPADAPDSEWAGLSGAAVICNGLVVAVHHRHQNSQRAASLEATLVSQVSDDPDWCKFLEHHGISTEFEDVIQLQEKRAEDDRKHVVEIIEAKLKRLEELDDQLLRDVAQEIAQLPGEGDSDVNPNDVETRISQTAKCMVNRSAVTDVVGCLNGLMANVEQVASDKLNCIADIIDHLLPVNYAPHVIHRLRELMDGNQLALVENEVATRTLAEIIMAGYDQKPAKFVISKGEQASVRGKVAIPHPDGPEEGPGEPESELTIQRAVRNFLYDLVALKDTISREQNITLEKERHQQLPDTDLSREINGYAIKLRGALSGISKSSQGRTVYCVMEPIKDSLQQEFRKKVLRDVHKLIPKLMFVELIPTDQAEEREFEVEEYVQARLFRL